MEDDQNLRATQSGEGAAAGDEEGGGESAHTPESDTEREHLPPGAETAQDDSDKA